MIEKPSHREAPKEDSQAFGKVLGQMKDIVGPFYERIQDDVTDEHLRRIIVQNVLDDRFDTLSEQFYNNALQYQRNRLQKRADLVRGKNVDIPELTVVNQAVTYHEYFPAVLRHMAESMTRYEAMRQSASQNTKDQLKLGETYATAYVAELNGAMKERVAFANVLWIKGALRNPKLTPDERMRFQGRLEEAMKDRSLSQASLEALRKDDEKLFHLQGNKLNQRIIDILAGTGGIPGVPNGFSPLQLNLDLLSLEYKELLEKQKEIARDPHHNDALTRLALLKQKNELAAQGKGEFTRADQEEFQLYQLRVSDNKNAMSRLEAERRAKTQELIAYTNRLGQYQMQMAEIAGIQRQFAEGKIDLLAPSGTPLTTPPEVRQAIGRNMETRKIFHLERIEGFLGIVDKEILSIGLLERTEEFSNDNIRTFMRKLASGLAELVTKPIPNVGGLQERAKAAIVGEINEAMGWPEGKSWDQLTPEEQNRIREKARSVAQIIREFKYKHTRQAEGKVIFEKDAKGGFVEKDEIRKVKETITLLKKLPPASAFIEGKMPEGPFAARVNSAEFDAFLQEVQPAIAANRPLTQEQKDRGARYYVYLFQQLRADWGDPEAQPPTGFMAEYAEFFRKIDQNIGVHLEVGAAFIKLSADMGSFYKRLLFWMAAGFAEYKMIEAYLRGGSLNPFRGPPLTPEQRAREAERALAQSRARESQLREQLDQANQQLREEGASRKATELNLRLEKERLILLEFERANQADLAALEANHARMQRVSAELGGLERATAKTPEDLRHIDELRRELEGLTKVDHAKRVELAKKLCPPGTADAAKMQQRAQALIEAHLKSGNAEKMRILLTQQAYSEDEARLLMKIGLAGDIEKGRILLQQSAEKGARLVTPAQAEALQTARFSRVVRLGGAGAGAVLAGLSARSDLEEMAHAIEQRDTVKDAIGKQLKGLGFTAKNKGTSIVYARGDISVNLDDAAPDIDKRVATLKLAADGAALAAAGVEMAALMAGASTGPGLIIVAGVVIAVHVGAEFWRRSENFAFIEKCPPWLLGMMGSAGLLGAKESEFLETGMIDLFLREPNMETKHKLLFSLFLQQAKMEGTFADLVGGMATPERLQALWKDFEEFVIPFYKESLFASFKGQLHLHDEPRSTAETLLRPFSLGDIGASRAKDLQMAKKIALGRTLRFYVAHVREKRYLELLSMDDLSVAEDPLWQESLDELGKQQVFGQSLAEVGGVLRKNAGSDGRPRTRAELIRGQVLNGAKERYTSNTKSGDVRDNTRVTITGVEGYRDEQGRDKSFDPGFDVGWDTVIRRLPLKPEDKLPWNVRMLLGGTKGPTDRTLADVLLLFEEHSAKAPQAPRPGSLDSLLLPRLRPQHSTDTFLRRPFDNRRPVVPSKAKSSPWNLADSLRGDDGLKATDLENAQGPRADLYRALQPLYTSLKPEEKQAFLIELHELLDGKEIRREDARLISKKLQLFLFTRPPEEK